MRTLSLHAISTMTVLCLAGCIFKALNFDRFCSIVAVELLANSSANALVKTKNDISIKPPFSEQGHGSLQLKYEETHIKKRIPKSWHALTENENWDQKMNLESNINTQRPRYFLAYYNTTGYNRLPHLHR